jgi:periplasmic divalent cation tolerance protein
MTTPCLVLTTVGSMEQARALGRALVEGRFAACVGSLPGAQSIYRWAGEVQEEAEVLLLIKTTLSRLEPLRSELLRLHPYELPELVVCPLTGASEPYLRWLDESMTSPKEDLP